MNTAMIHKIMESDFTEKFWHELNKNSLYDVDFLDAAICFAALREMAISQSSARAAQA